MYLATRPLWSMIHPRGESTRTLLEAVFSAEGSYIALAKIIKRASVVARSIFAILAAAPFFAASSQ